jgi:hypothetical protein
VSSGTSIATSYPTQFTDACISHQRLIVWVATAKKGIRRRKEVGDDSLRSLQQSEVEAESQNFKGVLPRSIRRQTRIETQSWHLDGTVLYTKRKRVSRVA